MTIQGLVSNWDCKIEEVSNNCYAISGSRKTGESFSGQANDPIVKIRELGIYASKINKSYPAPELIPYKYFYYDTNLPGQLSEDLEYILLSEILDGNFIEEYWDSWGKFIKLSDHFHSDSIHYVKKFNLKQNILNDSHLGKSEIISDSCEWRLLEPFAPKKK